MGSRRVQLWAAATVSVCLILAAATSAYLVFGRNASQGPAPAPASALPKVISRDEANQLVKAQWGGKSDCAALETFQENAIYPCVEMKGNARFFCHVPHLSYYEDDPVVVCHPAGTVKPQSLPSSQGL